MIESYGLENVPSVGGDDLKYALFDKLISIN